jgi:hypothetical protein
MGWPAFFDWLVRSVEKIAQLHLGGEHWLRFHFLNVAYSLG